MSDYLDPANEELLKDFFEEAYSQVDVLEQNIIVLENDPDNRDSIDEIFRAAHTLKGGAATVEMTELAEFTHLIEDVLDEIREGRLRVDEKVVDGLLKAIDITKAMVEERAAGGVYQEDNSEVITSLKAFLGGVQGGLVQGALVQATPAKVSAGSVQKPAGKSITEYELLELQTAAGQDVPIYRIRVSFNEDNPMNSIGGIQVFASLNKAGKVLKTEPDFDALYEDKFHPWVDYYISTDKSLEEIERLSSIPEVTLDIEAAQITGETGVGESEADETETPPVPAAATTGRQDDQEEKQQPAVEKDTPAESARKQPTERSRKTRAVIQGSVLRVDSRRIDSLLNLVGETIIIKAAFNQVSNEFGKSLLDLENAEERYHELLKEFFEELPDYITRLNNGSSVKEVKESIQERFEEIYEVFDSFEDNLKASIAKFRNSSQNLSRVTGELQEGVMKIRMVPISQLFSRFPRLVRDLTRSLKKKVNLVIEGEDTELDKSVIEDILDPLIHCVRNSIDHGLELPEDRKKAGKDEQGEIRLSAHNEGNSIIIIIADDGKGIEVETVRNKAIERGLIHPDKILTDVEAFNLIFEPGFSTAGKITSVSGRGVGLDVVRKQVEKLNGSVAVWSEKEKGSIFTIKLPLTLAIIQGLLVRISGEIYIIPITSVIESLRIRPSEINRIDKYEVFNLRDDVLSLVRLDRLFKIEMKQDRSHLFVVVVGSGDKRVGLMVESLIGEEDVVIKPLRDRYTESPGIAGATILGNGQVALILDVGQLLEYGLKQELEARMRGTTIQ